MSSLRSTRLQTGCRNSSAYAEFCWACHRREPRRIYDNNWREEFAANTDTTYARTLPFWLYTHMHAFLFNRQILYRELIL